MFPTTPDTTEKTEKETWAEPGFMIEQSRFRNVIRVLKQLIRPLKGDKTLPTPVGLALISLSLGIGIAAYNTSSNILFMTLSLLLSCLLLSGVLAWMNLHGSRWRMALAQHFRAGEAAFVRIELLNTKVLLPTYSLCFEVEARNAGRSRMLCQRNGLAPGERVNLTWQFTPEQRGNETIAIKRLESQFPFGFLRKSISGGVDNDIIIWPERIDYEFKPPYGKHWHQQGNTVMKRGSGTELINLRDYFQGDPMRLVHWKASARMRRMMVREMSEELQDAYFIFLETPARVWNDANQFETLCRTVASIGEDLYRRDQLWGVAINDAPLIPMKRVHDFHAFLDQVSLLETVDEYVPLEEFNGATIITFGPGSGTEVNIYVGNHFAGSTAADVQRAVPV
ncbi:MAG: DUF58 domain-containing protein [Gammaproteobacteria bacterium]|nr:DUF58 domain-containing protein [Gammaproteobacteria bacterium]